MVDLFLSLFLKKLSLSRHPQERMLLLYGLSIEHGRKPHSDAGMACWEE
jgi:hypothetical protein